MEKIITIDNKQVKFKATAGTPRRYLATFKRDMIRDLQALTEESQKGESLSAEMLQVFLDAAYVMAKHADASIPNTPEEWLDEFNTFSIYQILPQLIDLWGLNVQTDAEAKKKFDQLKG